MYYICQPNFPAMYDTIMNRIVGFGYQFSSSPLLVDNVGIGLRLYLYVNYLV